MLVLISGPSGVGKNHFIRHACNEGFTTVPPITSRPRRDGEAEGLDYEFVSRAEFQARIKRRCFLDWDYTLSNYYGLSDQLVEQAASDQHVITHALARMAVRVGLDLPNSLLVFLQSSSRSLLEARMTARGFNAGQLAERRAHWGEEEVHASLFDVIIPSGDALGDQALTEHVKAVTQRLIEARTHSPNSHAHLGDGSTTPVR